MGKLMPPQVMFPTERYVTNVTLVWFGSSVGHVVTLQIYCLNKV